MTRVAIFGPSTRYLSGISYYTLRLSSALAEEHEVSLVAIRRLLPARLFPGRSRIGAPLSGLRPAPGVGVFDHLDYHDPRTWLRALGFLAGRRPEVLVFQWWTSSVAHLYLFFLLVNRLLLGRRVVVEFHEVVDPLEEASPLLRLYSRLAGRLMVALSHSFVVHSEADRRLIALKYSIEPGRIGVVPHGLYDHYPRIPRGEARRRLGLGDDERVLLYFGLVRDYKGVPLLMEAFHRLPLEAARRARLLVVGEVWEGEGEVRRAEDGPHRDRITRVPRYVDDGEVALCFSACDLVVLPYLRASQSGVAHIAMAYGLPVVVSRVGGLAEALGPYPGAVFVEPGDREGLTRALEAAIGGRETSYPPPPLQWSVVRERYRALLCPPSAGQRRPPSGGGVQV